MKYLVSQHNFESISNRKIGDFTKHCMNLGYKGSKKSKCYGRKKYKTDFKFDKEYYYDKGKGYKYTESYSDDSLIIVDVQKSFSKFFTNNYIVELKKYCQNFKNVYQIWDNHVDGKNIDVDYLYDNNPDINLEDLYNFPNQKDIIEKRYNYDVDIDFYKKILDEETYNQAKYKESKGLLRRGDIFNTKEGTIIVYIGNKHVWYHCPKKLYDLLSTLKGRRVTMVGGSDQECFLDIETTAKSMGVIIVRNNNYIYSAKNCPIK